MVSKQSDIGWNASAQLLKFVLAMQPQLARATDSAWLAVLSHHNSSAAERARNATSSNIQQQTNAFRAQQCDSDRARTNADSVRTSVLKRWVSLVVQAHPTPMFERFGRSACAVEQFGFNSVQTSNKRLAR